MENIVHGVSGNGNEINPIEINKNQESVRIVIVTFIGVSTRFYKSPASGPEMKEWLNSHFWEYTKNT